MRCSLLLTLFSLLLHSPAAYGWGMSRELNDPWAPARLVFPALKKKEIKYCIRNEAPERFSSESMALQVESAFKLWLKPVEKIARVKVSRVDCAAGDFNIVFEIGAEKEWKDLGTYQISQWDDQHYYSLIKFDSGFSSKEEGRDYSITDFLTHTKGVADAISVIQKISFSKPSSVPEFANNAQLDYRAVFYSSYPSLIHELGHSFGLCDTDETMLKEQCDPDYSSQIHPASVMRDSDYFYLTPDDQSGIQKLFERFKLTY